MKISINNGNLTNDSEGTNYQNFTRGIHEHVATELARRVNGWDKLVAFVRSRATICCCKVIDAGHCEACKALAALRKAGVE